MSTTEIEKEPEWQSTCDYCEKVVMEGQEHKCIAMKLEARVDELELRMHKVEMKGKSFG